MRALSLRPARAVAATLAATLAVTATTLALTVVPAAHADEATDAPVTRDDRVTVRGNPAGGLAFGSDGGFPVLANDSDPDGDELAICRFAVPEGAPILVAPGSRPDVDPADLPGAPRTWSRSEGEETTTALQVFALTNRAGTYRVTYWACDHDYLTPATLTVTVQPVARVTAKVLPGRDRVRFTNPGKRRVVVRYGPADFEGGTRDERRVRVGPGRSTVVTVEHRRMIYTAFERGTRWVLGAGFLRGLRP